MSLRVLIVEDEPMAQANLSRTLQKYYPDLEIVGMTSSVSENRRVAEKPFRGCHIHGRGTFRRKLLQHIPADRCEG